MVRLFNLKLKAKMNSTRNLLIVDDEEDLREILIHIASKNNINCLQASCGNDAFEIVKKTPITAIFSDISMPNGNGQEFMQKVRGLGLYTPFVFITANTTIEHTHEALKLGAFDFLCKPFQNEKVIDTIFRAMDVGASLQEAMLVDDSASPEVVKKVKQFERALKKLSRYGLLK